MGQNNAGLSKIKALGCPNTSDGNTTISALYLSLGSNGLNHVESASSTSGPPLIIASTENVEFYHFWQIMLREGAAENILDATTLKGVGWQEMF